MRTRIIHASVYDPDFIGQRAILIEDGQIVGVEDACEGFEGEVLDADGCHLPMCMLRLIWKAKGTDGIELITDALDYAGCGLQEGSVYTQLNGMDVVYEDGVMKLLSREAFAGSVATTDRLLRTAVGAGIPLTDALRMMMVNPAKRIGLTKKGRIRPGFDADIVLLDPKLEVVGCISHGKRIRWDRKGMKV